MPEHHIPVRLVGSDAADEEVFIGDFPGGVVLKGMSLVAVETMQPIAYMAKIPGLEGQVQVTQDNLIWEVPRLKMVFKYIFIQVLPSDGSMVIDLPGKGRRELF